jgi:hypothetical protein
MHAPMIISAPDLVAYRRNVLCTGESVGRGSLICFLGSAGPGREVGVAVGIFGVLMTLFPG